MARSIAIIGGGIIGSSTAYYLRKHPKIGDTSVYLIEGTSIAAASSGKGAGFIALDWHESRTASLAELSFKCHEELAREHDGENVWGYRKLDTLSLVVDSRRRTKAVPGAEWLSSVTEFRPIGDKTTTAQAHPYYLTNTLASVAEQNGAKIILATADGIEFESDGVTPKAVLATPSDGNGERITIPATDVVFTAGPWTGRLAKKLLGKGAGAAGDITASRRSTSLVVRTTKPISPHALFGSLHLPNGTSGDPEVYPRPDGTVYLSGSGHPDRTPLAETAKDVGYSTDAAKILKERIQFLSPSHFGDDEMVIVKEQGCHRPDSSRTGAPVIGKIRNGIWVASGHQVWGISNGPGTGKVMAELLLDGKSSSADISSLMP